ncbi:MAG: FAD binding domain-containing protein [Bacteroidales bacterium]|nr:FAD binding domain-containing protein [Bacteroidales bacterium]
MSPDSKSSISFYLNSEKRHIDFNNEDRLSPISSVLNYLRLIEGKVGTKEGCGVGDCGSCTICFAEREGEKVSFYSVNSCLLLLPMLDGKHIFTIEWLSNRKELHPIQQALFNKQGTQCGFCSPGMVMSAYAHYRGKRPFTREEIEMTFSGNLCRCTGYESILKSIMSIGEIPYLEEETPAFPEKTKKEFFYNKGGIQYIRPLNLFDVLKYKTMYGNVFIVAGSTDLSLIMKKEDIQAKTFIDISDVEELKEIKECSHTIIFGSNTTIENFKKKFSQYYPQSGEYLSSFASMQIRNKGTLGGSISGSSPVGDIMPLILALNADIILESSQNGKRIVKGSYFITSYRKNILEKDEIISGIIFPKPKKESYLFCHKQSNRKDMDIATMTCCIGMLIKDNQIEEIHTGFGGMAATPIGALSVEKYLSGKEITEEIFKNASELIKNEFKPLSDIRGSSEYRLIVARNIILKCFLDYESSRYTHT